MSRVKRGVQANKRRSNVLKKAKGYRFGRKSKERLAKVAVTKAGAYARRDRRTKKGVIRRLWQVRINAALRELGTTYSKFIDQLKKKNVDVDRKILSDIAQKNPDSFKRIVENVK